MLNIIIFYMIIKGFIHLSITYKRNIRLHFTSKPPATFHWSSVTIQILININYSTFHYFYAKPFKDLLFVLNWVTQYLLLVSF